MEPSKCPQFAATQLRRYYPFEKVAYEEESADRTFRAAGRLHSTYPIYSSKQIPASPDERARTLPGDDLIPQPLGSVNHAITIRRPPHDVWPWLAQMGSGRAGWYACDFIDNGGLALVVDRQWLWRENRALVRRLRSAHLKEHGVIEDIDYQHPRALDRKLMRRLATSKRARRHQNLLLPGPTGIGKSWSGWAQLPAGSS